MGLCIKAIFDERQWSNIVTVVSASKPKRIFDKLSHPQKQMIDIKTGKLILVYK